MSHETQQKTFKFAKIPKGEINFRAPPYITGEILFR